MTDKHWLEDAEIIHDHEGAAIKELIERRNREAEKAIARDKALNPEPTDIKSASGTLNTNGESK